MSKCLFTTSILYILFTIQSSAQTPSFKVIAFFTGKADLAHISFVKEANEWFPQMAVKYHFMYDTTTNWDKLNAAFLAYYQIVLFLDTHPEKPTQRAAFEQYIKSGGAWMGFHFAAFALNQSSVPQNWELTTTSF